MLLSAAYEPRRGSVVNRSPPQPGPPPRLFYAHLPGADFDSVELKFKNQNAKCKIEEVIEQRQIPQFLFFIFNF
jgi:hypothetical protein